jgi:TonB family protein
MSSRQAAPTYFGRYQVLEELGSGAMGVVYLCVDPRLARPVAVKVIRESESMSPAERTQFQARFRHEAEAAGRLNHPGIVQIYDIGPQYLVMEYLDGKALSTLLKGNTTFTVQRISSIVSQVADAIDFAHKSGVVHRDVKPANIMLTDDGGVKVMDFGVARLDTSNLTVAGTVVGSVRYMAPEQMMGEKVDGRADVFSLAAVAYEMLTGKAPFPGKTITEVVGKVIHGNHVPPQDVDPRLPDELNEVFAKAFAIRANDRYTTAMDFAKEMHETAQPVLGLEIHHAGEGPPEVVLSTTVKPGQGGSRATTPTSTNAPVAAPPGKTPPQTAKTVRMSAAEAGQAREAVLLLDSEPRGARVHVDGHPVGTTPIAPLETAFGRHVVRMEADGREPVSVEIEVGRERPLKVVSVTLPLPKPKGDKLRAGQFVRFGPGVTPPQRVSGPMPVYPPAAHERGVEGTPVVELWIDEKGNVIDVAIVESAGAMLDGAVLEAVTSWRFSPATVQGVPVSVRLTLEHLFRR